jgi:hypothetical protein
MAQKVDQRAPKAIYSPRYHHVEGSALRILQHLIEAGPPIAAFARYAGIAVMLDHLPIPALGKLHLYALGLTRPRIKQEMTGPFAHAAKPCPSLFEHARLPAAEYIAFRVMQW